MPDIQTPTIKYVFVSKLSNVIIFLGGQEGCVPVLLGCEMGYSSEHQLFFGVMRVTLEPLWRLAHIGNKSLMRTDNIETND